MYSIEHASTGERRFVYTSRSGRRYTGATQQEVERKVLLASLHVAARETGMVHEICAQRFAGICSLGDLTIEQLRELNKLFVESNRFGKEVEKSQSLEPKATEKQIKRIVKLGRYSIITDHYGVDWFWKKAKEWIVRFRNVQRIRLDDLTNQEAWYLIRRLEKVEQRLLKGNRDED